MSRGDWELAANLSESRIDGLKTPSALGSVKADPYCVGSSIRKAKLVNTVFTN